MFVLILRYQKSQHHQPRRTGIQRKRIISLILLMLTLIPVVIVKYLRKYFFARHFHHCLHCHLVEDYVQINIFEKIMWITMLNILWDLDRHYIHMIFSLWSLITTISQIHWQKFWVIGLYTILSVLIWIFFKCNTFISILINREFLKYYNIYTSHEKSW